MVRLRSRRGGGSSLPQAPKRLLRRLLLVGVGFLCRRRTERRVDGHRRRILVIRPDHLGDALFVGPALRALRELAPQDEITALVGPWALPVYERMAEIDVLKTVDFPPFARRGGGFLAPYRLLRREALRLRAQRYDIAINLRHDYWWGAFLACVAGIPRRIGYDWPESRPFLNCRVPLRGERHAVQRNLELVSHAVELSDQERSHWLELRRATARLSFPVSEVERAEAGSMLQCAELDSGPLIVIHPGTRGNAKLWPVDYWAELADALQSRLKAAVLITGSHEERALCEAVKQRMQQQACVAAGNTTLGQLAAVFKSAALVLGVDSGPLHLATAVGAPTLRLYGPSDPTLFGPYGDVRSHAVVVSPVDCAGCGRLDWPLAELEKHDCMSAISVQLVLEKALSLLAASEAQSLATNTGGGV